MSSRLRWSIAAAAVLSLGCLNLFHPLLGGEWVGDIGDGRWNMYLLEHHYKVLTDRNYPGTYSSAPFWVPDQKDNLAYSDLMAGGLPLYLPARLLMARDSAFQVYLVLAALANFASFALLATEAGAAPFAALAVAGLYAFGAHRVQHVGHTQFALQAWGVLALWCLLRFLNRREAKYLFGFAFLIGLQTATASYSGYLMAIGAALWAALWLAADEETRRALWQSAKAGLPRWTCAALTGAVMPALLLAPYWRMFGASLHRDWAEVSLYLPRATFWFYPLAGTTLSRGWKALTGVTLGGEPGAVGVIPAPEWHSAGVAVWLTLLLGIIAFRRSRMLTVSFATGALMLAIVTRIPGLDTALWRLAYLYLPGADGMRDLRRMSMAANAFLLLACALAATHFLSWRRGKLILAALGALVLLENAAPHHFHYARDWYEDSSKEIRAALKGAQTAAAFLDPRLREAAFNYNFQLIGQELNIPVINGSSGRNIPGNPPVIRPADVAAKAGRLSFNGLVYLVPRASEAALAAELESAGFSRQSAGERFSVYVLEPVDPVYDLEIRALEPGERRARPGDVIRVPLLVRNAGNYVWQRIGDTPTQSVYKISKDTEPAKETNGMETDLQGPVFPGGYTLIQARVRAPLEPGAYQVRMMMIRQNKAIYEPLKKGNGYTFRLHVE